MYCSKCGKGVEEGATFCQHCGIRVDGSNKAPNSLKKFPKVKPHKTDLKQYKIYIIWGVIILCVLFYAFAFRCKAGLCLLPSSLKGEYCSIHTCNNKGCHNKVAEGKDYCYTHLPSTSSYNYYTPEKGEDVLSFSNVEVKSNSSYTVCTGTITNNGNKTYSFVEIKGKFKNLSGKVVDTDWTYAVGSEGLAPNESTSFRLSVSKDTSITKCDFEIIDYDKE